MRVAVIGAGGFVGKRVVAQLAAREDIRAIAAIDHAEMTGGDKVTTYRGDFSDANLRRAALDGAEAVIHLAAVLGGAAEADPRGARQVNIDSTLDLIETLKGQGTRFVFASSIAAYGAPLPDPVTDATPAAPQMLYGAHKVMIEVALSQHAARGWLDAVSLRVAGVMARDGVAPALKTAFMSRLFHAMRRGEQITLPVAPDSRTWMCSVDTVARNFVHAALLGDLGDLRAFCLPALCLRFDALVAALQRRFPQSGAEVRFAPDPETIALFGRFPELVTETADRLGFVRDADADALVARAFD